MEDQFNLFEDIASIDTSQGTKICTICKQEKAVTSFERASYRKDGTLVYKNQCIKCIRYHRIFRKEMDKFRDLYFNELDKWRTKYDADDYEAY